MKIQKSGNRRAACRCEGRARADTSRAACVGKHPGQIGAGVCRYQDLRRIPWNGPSRDAPVTAFRTRNAKKDPLVALIPPGYLNAVDSVETLADSFRHCGTAFLNAHQVQVTPGRTARMDEYLSQGPPCGSVAESRIFAIIPSRDRMDDRARRMRFRRTGGRCQPNPADISWDTVAAVSRAWL